MGKQFKCKKCGYESDEPMDFIKSQDDEGFTCNDCVPEEKEFKLDEKIEYKPLDNAVKVGHIKEFIKNLLTPNNISKGFVEVSTIRYYAGPKLITK